MFFSGTVQYTHVMAHCSTPLHLDRLYKTTFFSNKPTETTHCNSSVTLEVHFYTLETSSVRYLTAVRFFPIVQTLLTFDLTDEMFDASQVSSWRFYDCSQATNLTW
jgi:hypothetical protein